MLPDCSVNHVPGLYRSRSNTGCCYRGDPGIVVGWTLCVVAAQQSPVSLGRHVSRLPSSRGLVKLRR